MQRGLKSRHDIMISHWKSSGTKSPVPRLCVSRSKNKTFRNEQEATSRQIHQRASVVSPCLHIRNPLHITQTQKKKTLTSQVCFQTETGKSIGPSVQTCRLHTWRFRISSRLNTLIGDVSTFSRTKTVTVR